MKKQHSRQWPFLRITAAFVFGILIEWYLQLSLFAVIVAAVAFAVIFVSIDLFPRRRNYFLRTLQGTTLLLLIAALGGIIVHQHDIRNGPNWVGRYETMDGFYCRITEPLVEKAKTYKAEVAIAGVVQQQQYFSADGNAIIYFKKKDYDSIPFVQGQIIFIAQKPERIKGSHNPGAFDYARYCGFKNIYHQAFVSKDAVVNTGVVQLSALEKMKAAVRAYVLFVLRKNIHGANEQAIAEALIIGYRNNLDKQLVEAYSNTGVVHIIAISGLHLGIIFGMMRFLLKPLRRKIFRRVISPVLILSVIWIFAFVAGGAPSVLRAAVMFSIFTFAGLFSRRGNVYNTLASSAFVLLLFDPFALWDVGFQLSYAAVFSIVLLQRPLYNAIMFTNPLIDNLWKLSSVTLSAQVFTTPIVIYHFHQIPTLFLIANLVAVPLAGIILMGEIMLVVIGSTPAASVVGSALTVALKILNIHILRLNDIAFKVIDSIQINIWQAVALTLFLGAAYQFLTTKQPRYFTVALQLMFVFSLIGAYNAIHSRKETYLAVYDVPGYSAIDIVSNGSYHFIADTGLINNVALQNFHLKPGRIAGFSNTKRAQTTLEKPMLLRTGNHNIFVVSTASVYPKNASVVILNRSSRISFDSIAALQHCKYVIADASSSANMVFKWRKEASRLHLRFHAVREDGAWKLNL